MADRTPAGWGQNRPGLWLAFYTVKRKGHPGLTPGARKNSHRAQPIPSGTDNPGMSSEKNTGGLTWSVLLGRWVEFARSAVSLPETGPAGRYRRSVAPLITLHAVTHALAELELLPHDDQPPAIDRAEILIRKSERDLAEIWGDLPPEIAVFITEARAALEAAGRPWLEWIVGEDGTVFGHPGEILEAIADAAPGITLYVPTPGVPFFRGAVAACLGAPGLPPEHAEGIVPLIGLFLGPAVEGPSGVPAPRQVYRQFDFAKGGPVRDLIAPMSAADTPGQPLLVPSVIEGVVRPVPLPPRGMGQDIGILPVVRAEENGG